MNELVTITPVNAIVHVPDAELQTDQPCDDVLNDQVLDLDAIPRATIVSRNPGRLRALTDAMRHKDMALDQVNPDIFLKSYEQFIQNQRTILVVVLDDCAGSSDIISNLLNFRADFPATQVILVSAEIATDDLTCERLPLCDISLKWPLSEHRIAESLEKSIYNNVMWQDRLVQIGLEAHTPADSPPADHSPDPEDGGPEDETCVAEPEMSSDDNNSTSKP
jgi:hypothetical protein